MGVHPRSALLSFFPGRSPFGHPRLRRVDPRLLAALPAVLLTLMCAIAIADRGVTLAAGLPASPKVAAEPASAATGAFSQVQINAGLRALRKNVEGGEQVRSLRVLADGTLAATVVDGDAVAYVMARGAEVVRETIFTVPQPSRALNLDRVHGLAITRLLEAAQAGFGLERAQLSSLRLAESETGSGRFEWTGTWGPASAKLYADHEAFAITRQPQG